MNDRYLFRAKRTDNGEWVIGDLSHHKTGRVFIKPFHGSAMSSCEVDKSTICQYTGLTDKNGRKIWENDIVRHYNNPSEPKHFEIGVIYWNEDNLRYERTSQYEHEKFSVLYDCVYEVIGNIFDNPELLSE